MLTRDNAHAADVFDALTARRDARSRSSASRGCCAARGRRGRGDPDPARTTSPPTPRCSPCSPARAGRSARATWRCSGAARRRARRVRARPRRAARRLDEELGRAVAGRRPHRDGRPVRRARRPRRPAPTPPRRASGSPCWPPSCASCAATPASRCSTWSAGSSTRTGIDVELASSVSPAGARPAATTSTCSSRRSRSSRPSTATVSLRRAAGLLEAEDELGDGPRRRDPDRGRLGQAADRPPRQGAGVGRGVPGRRVREQKFPHQPAAAACGPSGPAVLPDAAARRRAATCRRCAGAQGGGSSALAEDCQGARAPARSCGSATSPSPGPGTGWSCRRTAGPTAARRRCGPSPYQRDACATRWPRGAGRRAPWRGQAGEGRAEPAARPAAEPPVAGGRAHRRGRCAGSRRPSSCEAATGWRRRRTSRDRLDAGLDLAEQARVARVGRRARPAAGEARRDRRRRGRGAAAVEPVGDRAGRGCATTPRRSPRRWPGRCRARRRRRPGSAPGSTPGSRPRFGQQALLDPDELPRPGRRRASTTTPTCAS